MRSIPHSGVALRPATSEPERADPGGRYEKGHVATECAVIRFKQARGGPRRQLLVTAGGRPQRSGLRKTDRTRGRRNAALLIP